MVSTQNRRKFAACALLAAALVVVCCAPTARAQYVGRINTHKNQPTLRSTAVLEYTGSLDHPTASRLIPIAVWNGESYQPGGLYLARPVPLTVETGTQYILEQAGTPKGYFDVKAASDVSGSWIAIGNYQKPAPPAGSDLKPSRVLPKIIGGGDSTPHFAHVPTATSTSGNAGQGATKPAATPQAPPVMSGRPRLTERPATASGGSSSASQPQQQQESAPAEPPIMSGRPILHEPATGSTAANSATEPPETVSRTIDPNRPHLSYGKPSNPVELSKLAQVEIKKLAGQLPDLEQMIAVSDAVNRPVQSFVYSWDSPEAEAKMESKVEKIAQNLLAVGRKPEAQAVAPRQAGRRSSRHILKPVAPVPPTLTDVRFRAFQLAYGSGATLVYSATTGEGVQARYITLIAQPDFSGAPVVLFKQITSVPELDVLPRMKLIDAVDTKGDNRADLIFALDTSTGRQYAIYQVANGTAQQVFVTGGSASGL